MFQVIKCILSLKIVLIAWIEIGHIVIFLIKNNREMFSHIRTFHSVARFPGRYLVVK